MKRKAVNDKAYCQGLSATTLVPCEKREKCVRWIEHYEFDKDGTYHYVGAHYCVEGNYFNFIGFDDEQAEASAD